MIWRDYPYPLQADYLGIAWAVVQPVSVMVVFSCVGRSRSWPTYGAAIRLSPSRSAALGSFYFDSPER